MTPEQAQEYREEAERLAELSRDDQRRAVALIRAPADNPKVGKRDREEARERADALERHLRRLNRKKKM
jgi:esterase/lipase superfamily enzyme